MSRIDHSKGKIFVQRRTNHKWILKAEGISDSDFLKLAREKRWKRDYYQCVYVNPGCGQIRFFVLKRDKDDEQLWYGDSTWTDIDEVHELMERSKKEEIP